MTTPNHYNQRLDPAYNRTVLLKESDLELLTYFALRTKITPHFCTYWGTHVDPDYVPSAYKLHITFTEPLRGDAKVEIWIDDADTPNPRSIVFTTDDRGGLDPVWNPQNMRLTETIAVCQSLGYEIEFSDYKRAP